MSTYTIILICTSLFIVGGYIVLNIFRKSDTNETSHEHHTGNDGVCCGRHTICDKGYDNSNLYFDDEELDRFKEKSQTDYNDDEIEEFRNVLYTMRREEVDVWIKCLQKRQIELPEQIKDEILLILQ